ncbi:MAG: M56 family metallopeptidase [Flavipsychrobacter sp.]
MLYILQVTIYTGLIWWLYLVLLRDKTLHSFNRLYLLLAAILPLVLPLIKLPWAIESNAVAFVATGNMLDEIIIESQTFSSKAGFNWFNTVAIVYVFIALLLLVRWCINYIKVYKATNKYEQSNRGDYIVLTNTQHGPGSWGKYIFLPDAEENPVILEHEVAHVRLKHSRDTIFISLLQAVFWPNIFIHILRKEITLVHEFQADRAVNANGDDYSKLLLSSVFATCTLPLSHSFIIHPVKRRIMMLKNRRQPSKALRAIVTLSLVGLIGAVTTLQSCEQQKAEVKVVTQHEMSKLTKMPECETSLTQFFIDNVKYPEEAKEKNIEGKVVVKFVVTDKGEAIDATVVSKDANPLLAEAALDAMKKMPTWAPGEIDGQAVSVEMMLPFVFKMKEDTDNPPPPPPPIDVKEVTEHDITKHAMFKEGPADILVNIYTSVASKYETLNMATKKKLVIIKELLGDMEARFVVKA